MNGGSDGNATPSYSATNGGWNSGTGVFTPTSGNPSASVTVGQVASVFVDGATTPVFVGRVTAVNATTVTVSTTAKSGTAPTTAASGVSINVGGCWQGPGGAVAFPFGFLTNALTDASSNPPRVNLKNNATYSITAGMTHGNAATYFWGYSATPGDGGKAVIDGGTSGASYALLTVTAAAGVYDLELRNNGATGNAAGVVLSTNSTVLTGVVVHDVRGNGFTFTAGGAAVECEAYACNQSNTASSGGFQTNEESAFLRCVSHDNAGSNSCGFALGNAAGEPVSLIDCIADANGSAGVLATSVGQVLLTGCVLCNNGSHGLSLTANPYAVVQSCAFVSNGGYGVSYGGTTGTVALASNAFYANTSGQTNGLNADLVTGSVTLTGDPFADAANGDFDLNSTSGAGAACKAAGRGNFTQTASGYGGTQGYPDIGASQTAATSDYPSAGDVRDGVAYNSGLSEGTLVVPAEAEVQSGVQYGAGGTEYTGSYAGGGGGSGVSRARLVNAGGG